jgi:hypothetical protein
MKTSELTEQERGDLEYVTNLKPQGVHHLLDLSDEAQYRFLMRQVRGSGATPERYPQLFADLDTARSAHKNDGPEAITAASTEDPAGLTDANAISAFGPDGNGNAAAQGFSSIPGGTFSTQLFMQVFDVGTGSLLSSTLQPPVFGQGQYQPIQTAGSPATQGMRTILTYSYTSASTGVPQSGTVHFTTDERPVSDPVITQPSLKPEHATKPNIVIGLGRGLGNSTDVDYWFQQPSIANPNVTVPFVGNVTFNSNIVTPLNASTNFQAQMFVVKPASGGQQQIVLPAGQNLLNFISVNRENLKQLLFTMPSGPNRGDGGTPATFGAAPWSADTIIYFHFQVAIKTATSGQDFVFANVVSRDQPDTDPIDGTLYIKPLQFTWHCIVEGTAISMAGGGTRPIESLIGGESVVMDAKGNTLTVRATMAQVKQCPVWRISTRDGGKVDVTGEHPMIGPDCIIQAEDLKPGDTLCTQNGVSEVESVEQIDFMGGIYNVSLGVDGEDQGIGEHGTTLIAGGILVGDMQIYQTYRERLRRDPDHIRKHLPGRYHRDFESSLEDIALQGHDDDVGVR